MSDEEKDEAEKKKKDEEEKKEDNVSEESGPMVLEKKGKRSLRFQLPEAPHSEESFTSALSYAFVADDEVPPAQDVSESSVLKKYIQAPLRHAQPRTAAAPCFSEVPVMSSWKRESITSASSSRQLFEILKHSPTPSDADLSLIQATHLRKLEGVKEAIRNGANINTFRDRQTPLLIATEIGDHRMIAYLLTVPGINLDFQNFFGQTALIIAVRNAFDKIVKLLLKHNANVNLTDHMGRTPLYRALFHQRPKMVKLLLAYGADFETTDCFGERPIYTSAVNKPNLECLMLLLRMGAQVEYTNVTGTSLLSRAILNWTDFNIIEALVKYGAAINSRDSVSGKTPLHFAAMINDLRVAKFLVSRRADVNLKTTYRFTPFDEAVFHKSLDVAEYLEGLTFNAKAKSLLNLKKLH